MRIRLALAIPIGCCLLAATTYASSVSTNDTSARRATVDLRDGSRLVGEFEQETLEFESDLAGEIRVPVRRIRSLEWPRPDQALARLKAADGDEFMVKLKTPELHLKTAFGVVRLKPALVKLVRVSAADEPGGLRRGLIALWSGEDNARDSVEGHDGMMLFGADFAEGKVGRAFHFGTPSGRVFVPDAEDFVINGSFTAAGWVRIAEFPSEDGVGIICMRGDNRPGLDTWTLSTLPDQQVGFSITSEDDETARVMAPATQAQWLHLAGGFDAEAGRLALYLDGHLAAEKETALKPIWHQDRSQEAGIGLGCASGTFHAWPFREVLDVGHLTAYGHPTPVLNTWAWFRVRPPRPLACTMMGSAFRLAI
jgi:hypothetical protein